MDPRSSFDWVWVLLAALAVVVAIAIAAELWRRRRNRADGVLMIWGDLHLTRTHLIIGSGHDALRLPLGGLSAKVDVTSPEGQGDHYEVAVIVEMAGHDIRRWQSYSYGASRDAQMFVLKFNALSHRAAQQVSDNGSNGKSDRHAA